VPAGYGVPTVSNIERNIIMKKIIALFAMAAAVVGVQAAEINLKVDGMVCSIGCVSKVKQSLTLLKGVDIKGTKFASGKQLGEVKVSFCDKTTSKKKILQAIKKAGYKKVAVVPQKKAKGKATSKKKA
jgi:copper chaperone CopZ|tara:strand:+ start:44 stop:427 length:384 start_codon:yes stop_codon:yes gene_type:complete